MKCAHDPKRTDGTLGQYKCPNCGIMVLSGFMHPEICFCNGVVNYQGLCKRCHPGCITITENREMR